jgi:hypothetical protein
LAALGGHSFLHRHGEQRDLLDVAKDLRSKVFAASGFLDVLADGLRLRGACGTQRL